MKQRILLLSFVMGMVLMAQAQTRTLTGKVTGADDGAALPGVNVSVKGTSTGTITDIDGNYKVDLSDVDVLVFSYIGYATQEVTPGTRSTVDVVLAVDAEQLEEVVVTALGIEREKKSLGYAVTELGGKEVSEAKENTFVNSLSGKVAGLQVSQNAGGVAGSARVVLRGNSSLTGDNNVLYVVDGIPFDNTSNGSQVDEWGNNMDYGNGIGDINPEDIATISVLKGATAAALYGSRATNGVILITTKKGKSGSGIGVSYTSNVVFEEAAYFPELQNTYGQGADGNFLTDVDAVRGAGS
ncbi:MAG: carboxypeptidase-like regulatory domain-containing protein, partial [Reichenbachiella sp.]